MSFDQWNNQADTVDVGQWLAAQNQPHQSAPSKQNTNKGSFITHLLPTIGGTAGGVAGGAAGGALAGTAILPGIGTAAGGLIGALLGGFAGGAGGKAVENHIEGQGLGNGVLGQGLEQGVLSAGPVRLLKGATLGTKAAIDVAKDGGGLAGAINAIGDKAAKPILNTGKNLITQGQQAQGRVAGLSAGSKVPGQELTPQDTKAMLTTLKTEGIKTGNANNTLRDIQDKLNQYGKQISGHFTDNNTPLTAAKTNGLASDYLNGLNTTDPSVLKQAGVLANDLKKNVSDTKSLWEFRKTLDSRIPDSKFMDAATTDKVTALKAMRQFVSDQLGDVPGASNYHDLSSIKPFISAEAKRLNNPGGGIVGRIAASGPVQKTEQLLGKGTEAAGNALNPANPYGIASVAGRTVPIGMLQAGANSFQNPSMATTSSTTPTTMSNVNMAGLSQNGGDLSSQQSQSPYGQENLMYDIQRDPKNADKYLTLYSSLDKVFNPSNSKTAIKPTSQQYGLAQGGMNALNQLQQLIQQDPSVINRNATLGQGLPVIGSLISNAAGAGSYHPLADSVLQSLIHLQTGATATPEEVKAARGQLPAPGDSPEEQQRKLQNLVQMFSPFVQGGNTAGTTNSPTDLASALASMGYGQ
jgi:hypothetical protein